MALPCAHKHPWTKQSLAEGHVLALVASRRAHDPGRLHAYKCDWCPAWHVGHGRARVLVPNAPWVIAGIVRHDDRPRRRC